MVHTIKRKNNVTQVYPHGFHKKLCDLGVWDKFVRAVKEVEPVIKDKTIEWDDYDLHEEVLIESFNFSQSEEGHRFWYDLYLQLKNKVMNNQVVTIKTNLGHELTYSKQFAEKLRELGIWKEFRAEVVASTLDFDLSFEKELDFVKTLYSSFIFSKSEKGAEYWFTISDKLEKLIKLDKERWNLIDKNY